MSRNGVGVYNLPSGQPVVTGTTISSTVFNMLTNDLANALTTSIATDGQTAMAANLPMGGFKLTNIGAATVAGDAIRFEQVGVLAAAAGANADITSLVGPVSTVNSATLMHVNDIVNGNFVIAQAGTGFSSVVSGAYDLDGWINANTTAAVFNIAQGPGSTPGRLARGGQITTAKAVVAAGDLLTDQTRIEGYNIEKYVGNTFTVGFRARVPVAGIHCVALRNGVGDRSYVVEINFPTSNVWQNCSVTVVGGLPVGGTWNYTNGIGLTVDFTRLAGTTWQTTPGAWNPGNFFATVNQVNDAATVGNGWSLEKVTLNLGTVAAVSEISFEQELIRCQRYYELVLGTVAANQPNYFHQYFKVPKRVLPTAVLISGSLSGAAFDVSTANSMRVPAGTLASAITDFTFAISARL